MNRDIEQSQELIDLGAASVETKGIFGPPRDEVGEYQLNGLSED